MEYPLYHSNTGKNILGNCPQINPPLPYPLKDPNPFCRWYGHGLKLHNVAEWTPTPKYNLNLHKVHNSTVLFIKWFVVYCLKCNTNFKSCEQKVKSWRQIPPAQVWGIPKCSAHLDMQGAFVEKLFSNAIIIEVIYSS